MDANQIEPLITYLIKYRLLLKQKSNYKNLQILNGQKLPEGWVGKVWALKQGVDEANKRNFEYFLFIDSDIYLDKGVVTKSVHC